MASLQHYELISDFFQVFVNSVNATLEKNLDKDICTDILFQTVSVSEIQDPDSLKGNNAVYLLDYATGSRQGTLITLIPEEFIASISDILTGGNGKDAYKDSISEIETNSILKMLEKIFKNLERDFKKQYDHDLVFSANAKFLLKEMPEYKAKFDNSVFDLLITNELSLTKENKFNIQILSNLNLTSDLIADLGLSETNTPSKHQGNLSLNVDCLSDVKINITAELGRTRVPIKYALELTKGSLVELDTLNNSDIKIYANGVEFAYAQVVAVEDSFGLKITKIISPEERLEYI